MFDHAECTSARPCIGACVRSSVRGGLQTGIDSPTWYCPGPVSCASERARFGNLLWLDPNAEVGRAFFWARGSDSATLKSVVAPMTSYTFDAGVDVVGPSRSRRSTLALRTALADHGRTLGVSQLPTPLRFVLY